MLGIGLIVGSFVNVMIHRLPRMIMADMHSPSASERFDLCWPASQCPQCHTPIKLQHNIPVLSFVWLKGRCCFCNQPISVLYPAVEVATGLLWLICAWHWGMSPQSLCWAVFGTLLLTLSIIDWQTTLLPDDLTQTLVWSGLMASASGWLLLEVHHAIWGSVAGYASLWMVATAFQAITGKQGMGAGDFKLLAGLGAWLGPLALLPLVMLASFSGACVGLFLKFTGRLGDDGYVPFGPFLALAGGLIAFIGVDPVMVWMGW
jgi:leader peptidase (prepilin peptidase)/N-methyltransferase